MFTVLTIFNNVTSRGYIFLKTGEIMDYTNEIETALKNARDCSLLPGAKICLQLDEVYFYNCGVKEIALEYIGAKLAQNHDEFKRRAKNIEKLINLEK